MKKTLTLTFAAYTVLGIIICTTVAKTGWANEKVIHITAAKFEFTPSEITVKKGEAVAFEIKSEDVKHGFSLPDFGVRADVKPGTVNRIHFTPDKVGQFVFTCDVFCGNGHEDMSGTLTVTD
jgi:cytochrome c oxidase subunit II